MVLTAWKGGASKNYGGFGLTVNQADRDQLFQKEQKFIDLTLKIPHGQPHKVRVNIDKPSFWNNTCREMISTIIGKWMHDIGAAPWPKGKPPKFSARFSTASQITVSCNNLRN